MALYYTGYSDAIQDVLEMSLEELLQLIDDLYGRDNLHYGDTVEQVREETLCQLKREFTDTNSEEYKILQIYIGG